MFIVLRSIVLSFAYLFSHALSAEGSVFDDAEWDLGVGVGAFEYQIYPGSKATKSFVLPVPYFTFKSPRLEIDRGIQGFLYSSERIVLDISADFALPVNSDRSNVRQGMPDLDAVLQLGPSIEFLLGDRNSSLDIRFEIPLRVALATDVTHTRHLGWLAEPRISFEHRRQAKRGLSYRLSTGLLYANSDYHAYYYDVAAPYITPQRAGYVSGGGYGGLFGSLRTTYRTGDWVMWLYLRLTSLRGSEIEDSPLVETDSHYFIGTGFAWVFASNL